MAYFNHFIMKELKVTKTFKLGLIFFISSLWLVLMRIAVSYMPFSDNVTSWLFSFLVQVIGMGLIPFLLYKQWIKGDVKEGFHLKSKIHPLNYVLAVVLGFLLYYLTIGVSLIYQNIIIMLGFKHITTGLGTIYSGWEVLVMQFITVAMMPAFFEEFLDRGLLMSVFRKEEDQKKVIIILAVIFALAHQNITQTGYTLMGGLVIAFMAVKTKSIWPGAIIHFINNGMSVIIDYSSQKQLPLGVLHEKFYDFLNQNILIIFVTWIATAFLIVYLLKLVAKLNYQKSEQKEQREIQMAESIYKLFGENNDTVVLPREKTRLWEYGMVMAAVALTFATTIFTFIWGVLR